LRQRSPADVLISGLQSPWETALLAAAAFYQTSFALDFRGTSSIGSSRGDFTPLPASSSVGASATRAAASRMVRPGGVIVHLGLPPGSDGLDIRKITLQEIAVTGSYCYTPRDFRQTVAELAAGQFGKLQWFEERSLNEGAGAFASIDAGSTAAPKIILRP
jgi:threonine dehydrogenase-like Zn-dependent dehydrogenase